MEDALKQMQAYVMAHRLLLSHLLQVARAFPGEGTPEMMAATEQMLRQGVPPLFQNWPEPDRSQMIAMAVQELDRIQTVQLKDLPPDHPHE